MLKIYKSKIFSVFGLHLNYGHNMVCGFDFTQGSDWTNSHNYAQTQIQMKFKRFLGVWE